MKLAAILLLALVAPSLSSNLKERSVKLSKENPVLCFICEIVFDNIEDIVDGSVDEDEITEAFEEECDDIPWPAQDVCEDMIKGWVEVIMGLIEQGHEITTEYLCEELFEYCDDK